MMSKPTILLIQVIVAFSQHQTTAHFEDQSELFRNLSLPYALKDNIYNTYFSLNHVCEQSEHVDRPLGECPKGSAKIRQCFESKWATKWYDSKHMTCFARSDPNKKLFTKNEKIKRTNFYSLVKIQNSEVRCLNETYPLANVCDKTQEKQPCTISGGKVLELHPQPNIVGSSDICWDYSFWRGKDRCLKIRDKGYSRKNPDTYFKTHPILCNYTQFDCDYLNEQRTPDQNTYCPNCYDNIRESLTSSCPCQPGKGSFLCKESSTCIPDEKKCDGVVHCINGEDESFETCKDTYPEEATITCIEDRPIGYDILIKAIPCNGIKECRSEEDEECEISDNILLGTMAVTFLVLLLVSILMRYFIWRYRSKSNAYPKAQCDFEIRKGNDLVNLKNESDQLHCSKVLKDEENMVHASKFIRGVLLKDMSTLVTRPLMLVISQIDILKDLILVLNLIVFLGGISVVLKNPTSFSSNVVFLFILTLIGPQVLAAARLSLMMPDVCKRHLATRILCTGILFVLSPFILICLKTRLTYMEMKRQENPDDKSVVEEWEKTKRFVCNYIKLELGLETIYQLTGQLILLGLAYSETRTSEGLTTIFLEIPTQEDDQSLIRRFIKLILQTMGFDESSKTIFLLVVSIAFSFISCVNAHIIGLSACRERFPIASKLMAALNVLFSSTTRILAMVLYFAVPLGLFNLLRHLQGEQYPWNPTMIHDFISPYDNGSVAIGNYDLTEWRLIDRWIKNRTEAPFSKLYDRYYNTVLDSDIRN